MSKELHLQMNSQKKFILQSLNSKLHLYDPRMNAQQLNQADKHW